MFPKLLLVIVAVSSYCCSAQQTAAEMVTGCDSITKSIVDLTALVKGASLKDGEGQVVYLTGNF
jgi:hypothetical protein